jgi:prephenate dehydratase
MTPTAPSARRPGDPVRIGFLGPEGTFTEEALLTEAEYADAELVAFTSLVEVLEATRDRAVDLGFVPLENAIEGTVRDILDNLIFEFDLLIQREVVLDIHLHLMAPPGTRLEDVERVVSIPMASAQCRRFLNERLSGAEVLASNSTADAARQLGEASTRAHAGAGDGTGERPTAAIAPRLAAKLYELDILAEDVEDHPDNQTRFVALAPWGIPAPTGHDRTSIACFQRSDHPGSLYSILSQFAARNINLSKLESRPTKKALGDYCFIIDFEGHVADAMVSDCLRDLHAELAGVKFLGSYPAAGPRGPAIRIEAEQSQREAEEWVDRLRSEVETGGLNGR